MASSEANKKQVKKPPNQRHKSVYFNTENANDMQLYRYYEEMGLRNFSGWVKSLIYQDMIRRNGVKPNPYEEYAVLENQAAMHGSPIPVEVSRSNFPNHQEQEAVKPANNEGVSVSFNGKDVEKVEFKEVKKEKVVEENQIEEEVEEPEAPKSNRSLAAQNFLSGFGRK
ncbi:hypothetical protein MOF23_07180 [Bacillus inaquosorum]|uniref:hypothetical protein n=1 Tax=Bacillus inaquosorum TaxID=483913 RepID=UPI002282C120|nr:hypothetical protein [Bacillus inaquosorum]MCY9308759.1 hypothetical protein [Bacillus inaquosorum]